VGTVGVILGDTQSLRDISPLFSGTELAEARPAPSVCP
jgi:hypothetical protein